MKKPTMYVLLDKRDKLYSAIIKRDNKFRKMKTRKTDDIDKKKNNLIGALGSKYEIKFVQAGLQSWKKKDLKKFTESINKIINKK